MGREILEVGGSGEVEGGRRERERREMKRTAEEREEKETELKVAEQVHRPVGRDLRRGYLIHQMIWSLLSHLLRVGHDNDPFCQPVIWRLLAADRPLAAANTQLALQLLNESVLRVALVHDDGSHFAPQQTVPVHGVHVGGLLRATDDRLQLQKVNGQRVERREQEAGTATSVGVAKDKRQLLGAKTLCSSVSPQAPVAFGCGFLQLMQHDLIGAVSVTVHAPKLKPKQ